VLACGEEFGAAFRSRLAEQYSRLRQLEDAAEGRSELPPNLRGACAFLFELMRDDFVSLVAYRFGYHFASGAAGFRECVSTLESISGYDIWRLGLYLKLVDLSDHINSRLVRSCYIVSRIPAAGAEADALLEDCLELTRQFGWRHASIDPEDFPMPFILHVGSFDRDRTLHALWSAAADELTDPKVRKAIGVALGRIGGEFAKDFLPDGLRRLLDGAAHGDRRASTHAARAIIQLGPVPLNALLERLVAAEDNDAATHIAHAIAVAWVRECGHPVSGSDEIGACDIWEPLDVSGPSRRDEPALDERGTAIVGALRRVLEGPYRGDAWYWAAWALEKAGVGPLSEEEKIRRLALTAQWEEIRRRGPDAVRRAVGTLVAPQQIDHATRDERVEDLVAEYGGEKQLKALLQILNADDTLQRRAYDIFERLLRRLAPSLSIKLLRDIESMNVAFIDSRDELMRTVIWTEARDLASAELARREAG
jgi:hypothetical protein